LLLSFPSRPTGFNSSETSGIITSSRGDQQISNSKDLDLIQQMNLNLLRASRRISAGSDFFDGGMGNPRRLGQWMVKVWGDVDGWNMLGIWLELKWD